MVVLGLIKVSLFSDCFHWNVSMIVFLTSTPLRQAFNLGHKKIPLNSTMCSAERQGILKTWKVSILESVHKDSIFLLWKATHCASGRCSPTVQLVNIWVVIRGGLFPCGLWIPVWGFKVDCACMIRTGGTFIVNTDLWCYRRYSGQHNTSRGSLETTTTSNTLCSR